ncbi:hypothetical protein OAM15_01920 [Pelagibacteraceae bacterium]|jgi:hypothetical protein|nr:hypothetical protein [Pelagibacteraceae bacterium]|tara:strand:+ start:382 stop:579 length:198 start_codon:yes stop_codon:yes gene_type:complete
MKKNKLKDYLKIIKQIEKVRGKNNNNWMDLYRLAFKVDPEGAIKIVKKIIVRDQKVTSLAAKLLK